jgi:hypothetical protein
MTEQMMVIEKNCTTGEEIIRPMTAEEIAQRNADIISFNEKQAQEEAEQAAKAAAKASAEAKLAALGLTPEEIAALR